ncbi:MAG: MAPEG family protein [Hyphomicrobiales bacterium]|nr:MAPEG family protein [Hyphomicrobiales bacterium]
MDDLNRSAFYAGVLVIMAVALALNTAFRRMETKDALGGDDDTLVKRSRAFGNLVEHAPLMIILLILMEYGGSEFLVHIFGIGFILSRVAHAYGLIAEEGMGPDNMPRMIGALGSWSIMILASLVCIF